MPTQVLPGPCGLSSHVGTANFWHIPRRLELFSYIVQGVSIEASTVGIAGSECQPWREVFWQPITVAPAAFCGQEKVGCGQAMMWALAGFP